MTARWAVRADPRPSPQARIEPCSGSQNERPPLAVFSFCPSRGSHTATHVNSRRLLTGDRVTRRPGDGGSARARRRNKEDRKRDARAPEPTMFQANGLQGDEVCVFCGGHPRLLHSRRTLIRSRRCREAPPAGGRGRSLFGKSSAKAFTSPFSVP